GDAQETRNITLDEPYVPLFVPAAETVSPPHQPVAPSNAPLSAGPLDVEAPTLQQPGLAQSALGWGSETLQSLRSFWDQQWTGTTEPQPNLDSVAAEDSKQERSANPALVRPDSSNKAAADLASTASSDTGAAFDSDSDSQFYRNSPSDANRVDAPYGLLPVAHAGRNSGLSLGKDSSQTRQPEPSRSRATTEPIFTWHSPMATRTGNSHDPDNDNDNNKDEPRQRVALKHGAPQFERPGLGVSKITVQNKFTGQRSRYRCNVIGENYRKRCVWAHTPWSTRIKVIWRFATFNKAEAIRTIGREVLTPRGLAGSYEDYIDYCKEEFAAVMRIFADPCAYPILFHCQHGKDRTGIVAMLLLGILGVDEEVIAADYAQSQDNLVPVRQRMELLDMGAVGLPPSFCDSPTFVMRNLLRHINYNYGSVRGYLRSAGLREQEINTIAWCLRGNFYGVVHKKSKKAQAEARRLYLHPSAARSAVNVSPSARGSLPPSSLQISRRESADWS
ncbi:hypothetical protein GGI06_000523, partial [Coemansia sp. S85]